MIEKVLAIIGLLQHWVYLIIFLVAFLEGAAFMGFLVPGETVVVLSGSLASLGYLQLGSCLLVISLGAILGDTVGYIIGKAVGKVYLEKHRRFLLFKETHIRKTEEYFRRHGGKTVFVGRFMSVLREMVPFTAGVSNMPLQKFLIYEISGGICWTFVYTLLGYFFVRSWEYIGTWAGKAGLFAFFVVLLLAGLSYLYRWLVIKQPELFEWLREKHSKILSIPFVRFLMVRHQSFITYVQDRFSSESYLGIHLVIGLMLSSAFVWIFAGLTSRIPTSHPIVTVDQWIESHILYFRTPAVDTFMFILSSLGSIEAVTAGSLIIVAYFLFEKNFDNLITYLSAIVGGSTLVFVLRMANHRTSQIIERAFLTIGGWSVPSAHGMISITFYGMIAYFIISSADSLRLRAFTIVSTAFIVLLIGMSKIYFKVHYPSDLLIAYACGLFWLAICVTGLEIHARQYRLF